MNREDLIRLKAGFDSSKRYSEYIFEEGLLNSDLTKEQIIFRNEARRAICYIEHLFEDTVLDLSCSNIPYDKVSISPVFSIFVDNDAVDENGNIIDLDNGIVSDYVGVIFEPIQVFDADKEVNTEYDVDYDSIPLFYTKFSDLIIGLNELGYEVEGISSFGDVCSKILANEKPVGEIAVQFTKEKVLER